MPGGTMADVREDARVGTGQGVPGTGFPVATTVRDALYDRIVLSPPELALIGTRTFLRLDRIQQLGFVSRVWPAAKHTRYEHALGVLHLTRLAVDHLRATAAGEAITDDDARVVAAAALLHDIGHYPFSHAIEELGPPVPPHEAVGRRLITDPDGELAPILRDQWGVDPARVAAVIDPSGGPLPPGDRLLRGLLSGPLDMDKLDYLPRDARACNVPYGGVDTARLIDALTIAEVPLAEGSGGGGDGRGGRSSADGRGARTSGGADAGFPVPSAPRVVVGAKGVSPLHSLINARQEMFDNVYWHHTNRACMAMLLRAVQEALLAGAVDPAALPTHDDASLLALLADPAMPAPTRRLTAALAERRVHKRAVEVSARAVELYGRLGNLYFDPAARRAAELRLAEELEVLTGAPVPLEAVLVDIPKPEKWRTGVWVRFDRPPVGFQTLMPWRDVVGLGDGDFKRYEEHRRLIRIVAAAPYRDEVAAHWERLVLPLLGGMI
ncbi:MAG: dNTP triphosphohydrolase, broad substrate specificity [uncultured Thermomicrobiales bacterium]|uniref:DNTP triphosphohydrolase, broad substrate specificity n=1 Tax=uncultured Thermomicrobiales bacterium TaxID=1645740 RepID=A0A6J4U7E7_9BACT|nr:MAG: dNTP triphosphohydrolase, broad substrate specificity [uncultured Thermomicrobiales bacterium]